MTDLWAVRCIFVDCYRVREFAIRHLLAFAYRGFVQIAARNPCDRIHAQSEHDTEAFELSVHVMEWYRGGFTKDNAIGNTLAQRRRILRIHRSLDLWILKVRDFSRSVQHDRVENMGNTRTIISHASPTRSSTNAEKIGIFEFLIFGYLLALSRQHTSN